MQVIKETCISCRKMEAASGFEPLNKGFADLCLTTWLRRLKYFVPCSNGCHDLCRPALNGANFIQCFICHVNEENPVEYPAITRDCASLRPNLDLSSPVERNACPGRFDVKGFELIGQILYPCFVLVHFGHQVVIGTPVLRKLVYRELSPRR
jgi:hypothetical protein